MEWIPLNTEDDLPADDGLYLFRHRDGRYSLRTFTQNDKLFAEWYLSSFIAYLPIPEYEG